MACRYLVERGGIKGCCNKVAWGKNTFSTVGNDDQEIAPMMSSRMGECTWEDSGDCGCFAAIPKYELDEILGLYGGYHGLKKDIQRSR